MCLQDMAIERKLAVRYASYNVTTSRWELPANPIRHTLAVVTQTESIEVTTRSGDGDRRIHASANVYYNGATPAGYLHSVTLRADELGEALCGPIQVFNGETDATFAPFETYPTADLDKLIEAALPT